MYKKILVSLIGLISITAIAAEDLMPLTQYLTARKDWGNDTSEVAYVGTRCHALYFLVGTYFEESTAKTEDVKQGKKLSAESRLFANPSLTLSVLVNNMSKEAYASRYKAFLEIYTEKMKTNKRLQNNVFADYIYDDMKVCNSLLPSFKKIDAQIKAKENQK